DMWSSSPLTGVGQQNSSLFIKQTSIGKAKSIHNTYLQVLVDGGLLALVAWLGAFFCGLLDLWRARARGGPRTWRRASAAGCPRTWRWATAIECSLAAFVASATFNSFDYLELPYWLLAFAGALRSGAARERELAGALSPPARSAAGAPA